jgi:26S proteasome regulatory subunit N10
MPLEATMIIIDNSEYMRNGDYPPTRFGAQADAVHIIFGSKTQANPENTVGVMTMAGKSPEVLVTPTQDTGKILTALHNTKISGEADISTGIQVAQLALKHRQNKNQRQRIIVFVGSPLSVDEKSLVRLAKRLKKNNVAVDIISFGEDDTNGERLKAFIDAVQSSDNSHLINAPVGPHLLSDIVVSSPILAGEDGGQGGMTDIGGVGAGGSGGDFEFGVDPSLDPELALALRMSMEEERARQAAAAAAVASSAAPTLPSVPEAAIAPGQGDDEEDALLQKALAMSTEGTEDVEMDDGDEMSEEDAIAQAIAMSMQPEEDEDSDKSKSSP